MLKNYSLFSKIKKDQLNESAPRIPNSEEYWVKKGKDGKKVALYFHDDLDGIYSATAMKGYLEGKGFEIVQYGIVNYQEGWNTTVLNKKLINIALDYAESAEGIDVYMDHHGHFEETKSGEMPSKDKHAVKTHTGSAYEGIMDQLGLPVDANVLNIIDMIDSAKYDDYNVDIKQILDFDTKNFSNKLEFAAAFNQLIKRSDHKTFIEVVANSKNINPSIYNIFRLFRILYPANNLNNIEIKKLAKAMNMYTDDGKPDVKSLIEHIKATNPKVMLDFEKGFLEDAFWRLGQMQLRTWGGDQAGAKQYVDSQETFKKLFVVKGVKYDEELDNGNLKVKMPGYQIIGTMCFVPSGTWANALRARAILEQHLLIDERIPLIQYRILKSSPLYNELLKKDGQKLELVGDISDFLHHNTKYITFNPKQDVTDNPKIEGIKGVIKIQGEHVVFQAKQPIFWILLQYGNTLQVASLHKFDLYVKEYLPKVDGKPVEDLGEYCDDLLARFVKDYGYNVNTIPDMVTKSGGHKGIGSISNIFGEVHAEWTHAPAELDGVRYLDLIKNTMISELSGIKFDDITMPWGDPDEKPAPKPRDEEMNKKVLKKDQIRDAQKVQQQYKDWEQEDIDAENDKLK